jgi:BirA family biotin operon repressor/biotin-[acetyl-CoA-carboxylase] ligase
MVEIGDPGMSKRVFLSHIANLTSPICCIVQKMWFENMGSQILVKDTLSMEAIKEGLRTVCFGQDIRYFPSTESTNLIAKKIAEQGGKEGTLVIADYQTRGKGRLARTWWSPPGANLLFSLIFRPSSEVTHSFRLTLLCSLAVAQAIRQETGLEALIKWPNDVYIKGKKVSGILSELGFKDGTLEYVVVGIGMNVNCDPSTHPELLDIATSLRIELKRNVSRLTLLTGILKMIEGYYELMKRGEFGALRESWELLSLVKGKRVRIVSLECSKEGIAESIDDEGFLIIRNSSGERERIVSGDVSLTFVEEVV